MPAPSFEKVRHIVGLSVLLGIIARPDSAVAEPQLFGLTFTGGQLVRIDPSSGATTVVGNTSVQFRCGAADAADRILSVRFDQLFQIDPTTGATTVVQQLSGRPAGYFEVGLAIDSNNNMFVLLINGNGAPPGDLLYRLDPTTGEYTSVGPLGAAPGITGTRGLACSPSGVLYATNFSQGLMTVNRSTGMATTVGGGANDFEALEFDPSTGICYAAKFGLTRIDPVTGNRIPVGSLGGHDVRAMALIGHGGAGTGDCNGDAYPGRADYLTLAACLDGPGITAAGQGCACVDLDGDGDSDLVDFRLFQDRFADILPPSMLLRGYLAAFNPIPNGEPIYIPGAEVFLRNQSTGLENGAVQTDLSGRFSLLPRAAGTYDVCWRAEGFDEDCAASEITVPGQPTYLGTLAITPTDDVTTATVVGAVRLKDGSSARLLEPMFNVNALARVQLLDDQGEVVRSAYVNNAGEYLLTGVPVDVQARIRAYTEGGSVTHYLYPDTHLATDGTNQIDLKIANYPPQIEPLVAKDPLGERLQIAAPGSIVVLDAIASDRDGDTLYYKWLLSGGAGTLSAPDAPSVTWQLPSTAGLHTVTLLVYDLKGGYAKSSLSLAVHNAGVPFSGQVTGTDGAPVDAASVEVNGQATSTDAQGRFRLRVPHASRYVMNIRKQDYGLISRVYDDSVTAAAFRMARASTFVRSAQEAIDVTDQRPAENCPGPRFTQIDWPALPGLAQPQWQNGAGRVIQPAAPLEVPLPSEFPPSAGCGQGIRVIIPPNSLVDEFGMPPAGNVRLELTTIDLNTPDQMPGDYTVMTLSGDTLAMQSYGAGIIEIQAAGQEYNLAPGSSATLIIPVDPSQLAAGAPLPPTIPLLVYDEDQGLWREEGAMTLNLGNRYIGTITHFSAFNADLIKTDQACLRILSPGSFTSPITGTTLTFPGTMPSTYTLEVVIPMGAAAPKILSKEIDNSSPSEHVLYNLPTDTDIVLVPIRTETDDCGAHVQKALGVFVVNTGGAQIPTSPNLPAGPPYNACSTEVVLSSNTVPEAPRSGEFLHGLTTFAAVNLTELDPADATELAFASALDQATIDYYAHIDPSGERQTLEGFKTVNQFDGSETRVVFANSGDLGFGRDMYCKRSGDDVACYVTNYGNIDTPDCEDAENALEQIAPVATVAMEYSRVENADGSFPDPERVVKFFVYNGDGSGLLNKADLDGFGERPIPQLCMVCHGGSFPAGPPAGNLPAFTSRNDVKLGSKFLPFDLQLYSFPASMDKASQQAAFKYLNEDIVAGTPPDPAIEEVVTAMYASSPTQIEDFYITGWGGSEVARQYYVEALAPACRTCHLGNVFPVLDFDGIVEFVFGSDGGGLGKAEFRVCSSNEMPHAKRTHEIYWASVDPSMPALFQALGDAVGSSGWGGTLCNFTPGNNSLVSIYDEAIQPIWDGKCINCHGSSAPDAGLNLTLGSHTRIVSVGSGQSSLALIEPGDPESSYLWHKVKGTHVEAGGSGSKMPLGCSGDSCVTEAELATIEEWINRGAPED